MRTAALALFLLASALVAQEEIAIPPIRPSENFYDAAGKGITVRFEVGKSETTTLEWIALKLILERVMNSDQMTVPDLRKLPEFRERFDFTDGGVKKQIDENRCEIIYTIRAKDDGVDRVPALPFRYYLIGSDTGTLRIDFPATLAKSVPLKVKPVELPLSPIQPIEPGAFDIRVEEHLDLLAMETHNRPGFDLFWLVPPFVGVVWCILWRWCYPDEAKLARLRQSRAARRAIARLQSSKSLEAVVAIFLEYLEQRFGLERWRTTPQEVADGLSSTHFDDRLRSAILDELRESDRRRFSPDSGEDNRANRFKTFILELEEAAR